MPTPRPTLPSIRSRITRTVLLMAVLWAVLIALLVRQVVHHEVDELMDQGLRESAEVLYSVLAMLHRRQPNDSLSLPHSEYEEHLVWQIIDSETGTCIAQSHLAPSQPLFTDTAPVFRDSPDGEWRIITLTFAENRQHFLLVAQSEKERQEARMETATYTLISALLLGFLVTMGLSWLVRRELRPVTRLSAAIEASDPLDVQHLPALSERLELLPMEHAIRHLGERLAQRIATERAFTAHASHALRTPLAGMDIQLALAIKEAPETLRPRLLRTRQAAARFGRVLGALLTMFRSGSEPQYQQVWLQDLLPALSFPDLEIECPAQQTVWVDPDLLSAVLFNLLDNAQRHGAHHVNWHLTCEAQVYRFTVHDDGEGCSAERLQQLGVALAQQDYRSETGLKGLGLILADLVMRAHRGHFQLLPVNRGFAVLLSWPVVDATHDN